NVRDPQRIYLEDLIGKVYQHQGKIDEAREWISRALQMYEELGQKRDMAFGQNELGELELQQGNYDAASLRFAQSIELARGFDPSVQSSALKNLAETLMAQKQPARALENAKQAASLAAERNEPALLWEAMHVIGRAYAELGDTENARQALT